jgi:outer membrane cobalamin receptor
MQKVYFLALMMFVSFAAYSQGTIAGNVKDTKTGEAVIGANVVIQGTTQGSATDVEGNFIINNVKEGTCALQVSSVTYKTHTIPNVVVETAKKITIDIALQEDVSELQEVVVQGTRQTDTDFDLLRSIKEAKVVVVGITAEQISRTLDRDAAQVLRRVPGITIKGDQFVQVRGLSERYNPVMLHNAYAPSVETDVRSFSFQTLPSNQLDKMLVFKSPSADLPGDFAGGVVKVFTKSIPDENGVVVDYSTQVRAGTTFSDFYHQQKDEYHATAFNTGYYDLPNGFPANLAKVSGAASDQAGRNLKNLWTEQKGIAIPDQRFAITFSKKFNIGKVQVGSISALNYSNAYSIFNVQRGDFFTTNNLNGQATYDFKDTQYNQQVRTGFLFNWAFRFSPAHIVEFKNLYNQTSNDQFVNRNGTVFESGSLQHRGSFDKSYRGIYSGQLLGTHEIFNKKTVVEWVAGYNNANRQQPDYKRYRQDLDPSTGANPLIYIPQSVSPDFLGRFFSDMSETAYTGGFSIKQLFNSADPLKSPEIKAGLLFEDKSRQFNARNIGYEKGVNYDNIGNLNNRLAALPIGQYLAPQNINAQTSIQLAENTNKKDSYTASNRLLAYYVMGSIPLNKFKIDVGVRLEDNLQQLNSFDLSRNPVIVSNPVTRVLPSANLSYHFNEKMLVRAAYGETLNRPEFRELAPFQYFDFNYNFLYSGTPTLKTAKIQNVDVRWEYYPSKGELITFGGFYKNFKDPIEAIVDPSSPGGGVKNITFQNAEFATVYGVELEIKKSLADFTGSKIINRLNLLFNATLLSSTIQLPANIALQQETSRPLQGQAPYVINTALFYTDEETGWQVNLLHNVVGKNIVFVGNDNYASVYLMPRNVVDLTVSKRITQRFLMKAGVSDIFNQPLLFLQNGNADTNFDSSTDNIIQSYKPGQVFSLGFSYRF